jgi:hypothetical protein
MTLLARDEADIVDAQISFHLNAGVDFVVATDNGSEDETTEILERYARAGFLHLIREGGDDYRQAEWVTRMARLAATEFGADWVINADADEFWWPRGGSLRDVLATVPERYGVVKGCWRHFPPRPEDGRFFAERMTVRLCTPADPGDKRSVYHVHQKVAHRADPHVVVEQGNHGATGAQLDPIRAWHPFEVLHFSFRSVAQLENKGSRAGWARMPTDALVLHQFLMVDACREGRVASYYDSFAVDDRALEHGLANGTLAIDTRLRNALRTLRDRDGGFALPGTVPALSFAPPGIVQNAAYAVETSTLIEIDGIVRAVQRVAALEERLDALEGMTLANARQVLTRRVDRWKVPRRLASR